MKTVLKIGKQKKSEMAMTSNDQGTISPDDVNEKTT
jgi:hypothetical protein